MRISDWSSDVCSSDLFSRSAVQFGMRFGTRMNAGDSLKRPLLSRWPAAFIAAVLIGTTALVLYVEASVSKLKQVLPVEVLRQERDVVFMIDDQIGRASCRERVCQYV